MEKFTTLLPARKINASKKVTINSVDGIKIPNNLSSVISEDGKFLANNKLLPIEVTAMDRLFMHTIEMN